MQNTNMERIALIRDGTTYFSYNTISYIVTHHDNDGVIICSDGQYDPQLIHDIMVEFDVSFAEVNNEVVALRKDGVRRAPEEPEIYESLADTFRGVSVYLAALVSLGILAAMTVYWFY